MGEAANFNVARVESKFSDLGTWLSKSEDLDSNSFTQNHHERTLRMQLEFNQLQIPPGNQVLLTGINWSMFETLLAELGETRATRLSYSHGKLEIMVPLPDHEVGKVLIGDLVKALLEELNLNFWSLGSTTLKNAKMTQAVEPDDCFYITQEARVRNKSRLDLTQDPPPDLAIEIDITSRTRFDNYQALGVPELWRYDGQRLQINLLQDGQYVESATSRILPGLPLTEIIPKYLAMSRREGRNSTMRQFRQWVRQQMST
jgi:Uma2 family endonuclease